MIRVAGIENDERRKGGDLNGDTEGLKSMLERDKDEDTEQGGECGAGPMGDLPVINAILQNLEGSNGTNTDTETNSNNLTVSNLVNNEQEADFQEQLKGTDDKLKKYDNVEGIKETQVAKSLEEGSG